MNDQTVREAIGRALAAGHFFAACPRRLRIEHVPERQMPWEVFRGHLLAPAHATSVKRLASWHVCIDLDAAPAEAPLVSLHWDSEAAEILVTRQILTYGFEPYEDSPGVILSRPVEKWIGELVGTIDLAKVPSSRLQAELCTCLFLAVIGTSRLPITSLEAPLPAFSLGQIAYLPSLSESSRLWTDPIEMLRVVLSGNPPHVERAKALETALRATVDEHSGALVDVLLDYAARDTGAADRVKELFLALFNHVALSPYTGFADRMIDVLDELATAQRVGPLTITDTVGAMLRHVCRHLTAFDLTTFHNFGANFPDALFLDGLLKEYLRLVERHRDAFVEQPGESEQVMRIKRVRRRALRQACLVRQHYAGHRVPDAPTSQGENVRVLPAPFVRVPQDQILHPGARRRTLFAEEPLERMLTPRGREVLHASLADLDSRAELHELGMATFLDRPLGAAKQPGEVDRTPLVSYTAFSRATVVRRLGELERMGWISADDRQRRDAALKGLPDVGVPIGSLALVERPGVVSLADARRAASDYSVLRANRESFNAIVRLYDWTAIDDRLWSELHASPGTALGDVLLLQRAPEPGSREPPTLRLHDFRGRWRVELGFGMRPDGSVRFVERGGIEMPEWMQVLRVRESVTDSDELVEREVRDRGLLITRRDEMPLAPVERTAP